MPSRLRLQHSFDPFPAETTITIAATRPFSAAPANSRKNMSLSQTFKIAASARTKLGREAARPDHNLRRLVGHANLLDALMLELHEAERDQERWFNLTVQKAQKADDGPRHVVWADTIVEDDEAEYNSDDSDSDDDDSDLSEPDFDVAVPLRRLKSPPVAVLSREEDDEDEDGYDEDFLDDDAAMDDFPALTRTASRDLRYQQPPDLIDDSSEDDESPPPSPPQPTLPFTFDDVEDAAKHETLAELSQDAFMEHGFFMPERHAPLIAVQA